MRLMEPYRTKYDEENIINGEKIAVKGELNEIILRRGDWGEVINMFQKSIILPTNLKDKSYVEQEIWRQQHMNENVETFWQTQGAIQFPKVSELAIRLSLMSVQSADVERICKVNKIIHTKTRNRLVHDRTQKLLYCFINTRLLHKSNNRESEFLLSVDSDDDIEVEDNRNPNPN